MQTIVSVVLETFSWQPNKEPLLFESVFGTFSVRLTGLSFLLSLLIAECVSYT